MLDFRQLLRLLLLLLRYSGPATWPLPDLMMMYERPTYGSSTWPGDAIDLFSADSLCNAEDRDACSVEFLQK